MGREKMNDFAWYLDLTPNNMFSLYDHPLPGKDGLALCEQHGQQLELKEVTYPTKIDPIFIFRSGQSDRSECRKKSYTFEQIFSELREAEVFLGQGQTVGDICLSLNISEQTYYRWRKEYDGIRSDQVRRLKKLEKENARLKNLVAELSLDNSIMRETVRGN